MIGIPLCTAAGRALGGKKDNQAIIWDEIVIDADRVPAGAAHQLERSALAGFVLHRLFDITKPPPARQLERLPDGLGVMADDCGGQRLCLRRTVRGLAWLDQVAVGRCCQSRGG